MLIALWGAIGGNMMVIFLAGLQGIPQELYEAASIDGAGAWQRFWHVTLPMISPTMFFNTVLACIGAFQTFEAAFIGTQGGPAYATWLYGLHIYEHTFKYFDMGYGSTLAWIIFIVLSAFTYLAVPGLAGPGSTTPGRDADGRSTPLAPDRAASRTSTDALLPAFSRSSGSGCTCSPSCSASC